MTSGLLAPTCAEASSTNGTVYATVVEPDGSTIIAGSFTSATTVFGKNVLRDSIAKLRTDGSIDPTFNAADFCAPSLGANGPIYALALQPDGKILIAGAFTEYNGTIENRIARLMPDGSIDPSFNASPLLHSGANGTIRAMVLQPDGAILIGGNFSAYDDAPRQRVARLHTDGTLDAGFGGITTWSQSVNALALQSDGKVIVGGNFNIFLSGSSMNIYDVARFNADGTLDTAFSLQAGGAGSGLPPSANTVGDVNAIALRPDGSIILAGGTPAYGGRINILTNNGMLDSSFAPATANDAFYAVYPLSDGSLLAGGNFTLYNGMTAQRLIRIEPNGSLNQAFSQDASADAEIRSITPEHSGGDYLLSGAFSTYGGFVHPGVVRVTDMGVLSQYQLASLIRAFYDTTNAPWSGASLDMHDLNAAKQNLIVITHGWNGSTDNAWVQRMRDYLVGYVDSFGYEVAGNTDTTKTTVRLYDWQTGAGTGQLDPTQPNFNPKAPFDALYNAAPEGDHLAQQIEALDPMPKNIHFIAHSAGSNVIQTAVDDLASYFKNQGIPPSAAPHVQLTFLDAFAPIPPATAPSLADYSAAYGNLHDFIGYAEQYVDTRPLFAPAVPDYTNMKLSHAVNFDVTPLDASYAPSPDAAQNANHYHTWPITVYTNSMTDPSYNLGFPFAAENAARHIPSLTALGAWCTVTDPAGPYTCRYSNGENGIPLDSTSTPIQVTVQNNQPDFVDVSDMFSQGATTLPAITINSPIANVHIPAGTIVTSSDSHWDGHLAVPKEAPLTVLTPDWIEIQTVMIGADSTLTFDKAVRIELPDQAGKEAGFIRNGLFVPITTWCAADTQDFADTLLAGGDCKIDTSNELVIWTKHFTTFVTYHPGDTIAPTTTAEIAGTPGTHGWFASNISVTLNAVDNPGGSGVDYTKYSLDNGSWQTYATTSPISIASEGVHTLQFYSTDKAGNQEATSTLAVKIDKTPPEAMIGFSTSTKIIQFTGTDNLTAVTAATTTTSIILSDQAGNTLKLSIAKNVLKPNSATFIVPAFGYSTGTTTNASTSLRYFWSTDRAGKYTLFISAIKTPTQRIVSIYTSLTNKTYIVTSTPSDDADDLSLRSAPLLLRNRLKTFTGLEIPSVSTQRGAVVIDY